MTHHFGKLSILATCALGLTLTTSSFAKPVKKVKRLKRKKVDTTQPIYMTHYDKVVNEGYTNSLIKHYNKMSQHSVNDFYKYEFLMRSIPGVYFTYFLEPNFRLKNNTTYDLKRYIFKRYVSGTVSTNNLGTTASGRQNFKATLALNGLLGNDQLGLAIGTTSKGYKSESYKAQYKTIVGHHGTELSVAYDSNYSKSDKVGLYQSTLNGKKFLVSAYQPFWINRANRIGLVAGYGITRASNDGDALGSYANLQVREQLPYIFVRGNWNHFARSGDYDVSGEIVQGGNFLGNTRYSTSGQDGSVAANEPPNTTFTILHVNFKAFLPLKHHMNLAFIARAQKLISHGTLFVSKKFYIGDGAYIGRGFMGDEGIEGKTEFSYNIPWKQKYFANPQTFTFYDWGHVYNYKQIVMNFPSKTISSIGFGFRGMIYNKVQSFFELALPIGDPLARDHNKDWQFFFGASYKF